MTRTLTELSSKRSLLAREQRSCTRTITVQGQLGEREDNFDFHNCNLLAVAVWRSRTWTHWLGLFIVSPGVFVAIQLCNQSITFFQIQYYAGLVDIAQDDLLQQVFFLIFYLHISLYFCNFQHHLHFICKEYLRKCQLCGIPCQQHDVWWYNYICWTAVWSEQLRDQGF